MRNGKDHQIFELLEKYKQLETRETKQKQALLNDLKKRGIDIEEHQIRSNDNGSITLQLSPLKKHALLSQREEIINNLKEKGISSPTIY